MRLGRSLINAWSSYYIFNVRSVRVILGILVVFVILSIVFMHFFVNPIIADYSKAKIEAMSVKAVNRAVSQVMSASSYKDLTDVRYGADGKIMSLNANTVQINTLTSDIALLSQRFLELFATTGIEVPVGTFSGMPILTGKGPNVNLRVVPVGAVNCIFDSKFYGAGINQTHHRIILRFKTVVNLIMPLGSRNVTAEIEVLLCDSVIVGEVPELWFPKLN